MDAKVKKEWVEALRSGKYQQGKEQLAQRPGHSKTQFCCLGVLCEITPELKSSKKRYAGGIIAYRDSKTFLPSLFAEQIGIPHGTQTILAQMNDSGENDFNKIADYIEKEL